MSAEGLRAGPSTGVMSAPLCRARSIRSSAGSRSGQRLGAGGRPSNQRWSCSVSMRRCFTSRWSSARRVLPGPSTASSSLNPAPMTRSTSLHSYRRCASLSTPASAVARPRGPTPATERVKTDTSPSGGAADLARMCASRPSPATTTRAQPRSRATACTSRARARAGRVLGRADDRYVPTSSMTPIRHASNRSDGPSSTITPAGRPSSSAATSGRTYAVPSTTAARPTGIPTATSKT